MALRQRLTALFHRDRLARDLDDELRFHLDMREGAHRASGMSAAAARRAARMQFGNPAVIKERTRQMDLSGWLETAAADVRFGARLLARSPGFTAVAVLTLALGIGANTAIWSVVDAVLLQPLPYRAGGDVVVLGEQKPCCKFAALSPAKLADFLHASHSFSVLSAGMGSSFVLNRTDGDPLFLLGTQVAANYFDVFGVAALHGRTITPAADHPGGPCAAVLSYGAWRRDFGADRRAVGHAIKINDRACTVVGVMPQSFSYINRSEIWVAAAFALPLPESDTHGAMLTRRDYNFLRPVGRLRAGVTPAAAQTEIAALNARILTEHADADKTAQTQVRTMRQWVVRDAGGALWILLGAVGLILLIACSNLASLLLARGSVREREIALRSSLGAGRVRLARQLLTETWLLAILGGAAGVLLALWALHLFTALSPEQLPRVADLGIRPEALALTAALSVVAGTLAGLAPVVRALRLDSGAVLKQGAQGSRGGGQRLRGALVVAQIAMSLALLIGAGLLIRSFANLMAVDPGFQPEGVLGASLQLPPARYHAADQRAAFTTGLLARVAALPGVAAAGVIDAVPFGNGDQNGDIQIEGRAPAKDGEALTAEKKVAGGNYFRAMGIPVVAGRAFDGRDRADSAPVVIINRYLATTGWPGQDPIGRRLSWDDGKTWMTVVGVVGNVHLYSLDEAPMLDTYRPYSQLPIGAFTLVVRRPEATTGLGQQLRHEVLALDPRQPVGDIGRLADWVDESLAQKRLQMLLLGSLAALALVLASLGVYGLISYAVEQRSAEIGVRIALGARRGQVFGLIMRSSMLTTVVGIVLGAGASLALGRSIEKLLFAVHSRDLAVYVLGCGTLLVVAVLAAYLPARRAAAIDPVTTLRRD